MTSKLPDIGTNIFSVMSAMAQRCGAINLAQGFPGFDCDQELKDLLTENMAMGRNQYALMPGVPDLRAAIASKTAVMHGVSVDDDLEITITAGATQALYTAIGTVIRPGDNAIVFDPAYDSYAPAVLSYGGTVTAIPLTAPDFQVDWAMVRESITDSTRLIVINTPHNPLGRLLGVQDFTELEKIAVEFDLLVISDEVYEHIVFDGLEHISILRFPALRERSFAIFSFGKVFHATGWKTGYCIAPEMLTAEFRKMHQFIAFAVHTPTQYAYARYLQDASRYLTLSTMFQSKRDLFVNAMNGSGFKFLPCQGSYFVLADYSEISDLDDMAFAEWLTKEHGVATIPLSPFYSTEQNSKLVRFCFAKNDELLERAAEQLIKI